jgi:hypothetical protein
MMFDPADQRTVDEVGNTEMLPWMVMFGAIGNRSGELVTHQPTWHHGHAVMRFILTRRMRPPRLSLTHFEFHSGGYQFYNIPIPPFIL